MTGNQVDPGAPADPPAGAATALLLALNGEPFNAIDSPAALSVIVAANDLHSASGTSAPAALLTLPPAQPCSITGNVVVNSANGKRDPLELDLGPPSLWLTVDRSASDQNDDSKTIFLTVSGNALQGRSDLRFLPRGASAGRPGWSPYNADPT